MSVPSKRCCGSDDADDGPINAKSVKTISSGGEAQEYKSVLSFDPTYLEGPVGRIINAALDPAQNRAMERLTFLCDHFGHRLSGTDALEKAIDWCLGGMAADGLANVQGLPCAVPHWVRGKESAVLTFHSVIDGKPHTRQQKLNMLGVGNSVGTPKEGIHAEVVVVSGFDEMKALGSSVVAGKIVLYNVPFTSYGETVRYRSKGASRAAELGAVAVLIRSVTPFSLSTPHTGVLSYDDGVVQIPAACVTIEEAELAKRLSDAHARIECELHMEAMMLPDAMSRNVIAEIPGTVCPEEVVVLGGHIDSWDVGQGAHDDGSGCVTGWEALRLIKALGLKPRRTIRAAMWTNEENGSRGGTAYLDWARANGTLKHHVAAMESDLGVYTAIGFGFSGSAEAHAMVSEVIKLLAPINATQIKGDGKGVDITPVINAGVPGLLLRLHDDWWIKNYFWFHHTEADTIDKIDPKMLRENVAVMAATAFILADMPDRLPQHPPAEPGPKQH